MKHKTKDQLLKEIYRLNAKIAELEKSESERKLVDPILPIEKEFSESLLETANTIILTLDKNAGITLFNKFAEKLTGYKKDEVLGKNWFDLFIPKRNGLVIPDVFKDVLKEMPEVSSHENPLLCKNGSERMISWENTVLKDKNGQISGILSIGLDITERKQAEEELSMKESQYRGIFEASMDTLLIFDLNGVLTEVNTAACEMYGYSYEEMIGLTGKEIVHPDYQYLFKEFIEKATAEKIFSGESVDIRKDGSCLLIEVKGIAFEYKGKPHLLTIIRDISKRKQAEEELKKHRDHLEEMVEERTRELEEKNKKLDDAMKVFVGRELTISDLQKKISALQGK